jgi:hypothetical protein
VAAAVPAGAVAAGDEPHAASAQTLPRTPAIASLRVQWSECMPGPLAYLASILAVISRLLASMKAT